MNTRDVIVMSGCSGSGKSTLAKEYAEKSYVETGSASAIVSADDYFLNNGIYAFDPGKLSLAHGSCFGEFILALQQKVLLVIVDNTNTTVEEISPYMLGATAFGYSARIVTLDPSDSFFARYSARNAHNVNADVIANQAKRIRNRRLPPWYASTIVSPTF